MKPMDVLADGNWSALLAGLMKRSNESKANETDDYRRDVNLLRDTCDAMEAQKGKRKPRTYLSFCHVDNE